MLLSRLDNGTESTQEIKHEPQEDGEGSLSTIKPETQNYRFITFDLSGLKISFQMTLQAKIVMPGWFTMVPLKPLSDKYKSYQCFHFFKLFVFICGFTAKVICAFLVYIYEKQKYYIFIFYGGSLEITYYTYSSLTDEYGIIKNGQMI